jgi:hypothetical protein
MTETDCFGIWSFGDWKLFGIWDLDIGIFPPRRDLVPAMPAWVLDGTGYLNEDLND